MFTHCVQVLTAWIIKISIMVTYKNCNRKQRQVLMCISSYLLYNVLRDRLEEFKKISNLFYKDPENNLNEHYNLHEDRCACLEVAFDLTLTNEEIESDDKSGELWEEFFKVYHKHEEEFTYSNLFTDSSANIASAEKVLNEWETFLNGYRCSNNKITEHETE